MTHSRTTDGGQGPEIIENHLMPRSADLNVAAQDTREKQRSCAQSHRNFVSLRANIRATQRPPRAHVRYPSTK
ncbi:hypothetical protein J6590_106665 [Homalodisca vitripennis]|nr:hypothetical protein J6590_106665 [Homalodisca vitripennis]